MVFIVLEKTYDRISREVMWWVLWKKNKGVPLKYIKLIKDMCDKVVVGFWEKMCVRLILLTLTPVLLYSNNNI